ncbi:MAG: endolytic transglycosylase MltG [Lachnospiraceae bacterium]|nr:endolytic transglycosylase MltG [Lachnospiraceae bacterium]
MATAGRSSKIARALLNLSVIVLTIGIAAIFYTAVAYGIKKLAAYSYDFTYQIFGDVAVEAPPGRDVKVTILKGENSMNIASKLEDARVIVNKYSFYAKLKLKEYDIMPGTFILNTSMSYDEVLDTITDYTKSIDAEITVDEVEDSP